MSSPLQAPRRASLGDFADAIVRRATSEVIGWVPAEVVAFHPPGLDDGAMMPARVDVRILVKYRKAIANANDLGPGETLCPDTPGTGAEAVGSYPEIKGVPVGYPGVRAFRMRSPVAAGEMGKLHVSGRDLLRWRQGELDVTPAWLGGQLSAEHSSLNSAVWTPGLEVGPTETATFDDLHRLGDDAGLGSLSYNGAGAWGLDGLTVDVRAPSTSIGAAGPGVGLAKNAQVLSLWAALIAGINALPPGPVTAVDLQIIANALSLLLPTITGTTTLTAE